MLKEFKAFALKGNMVDMAVGIIIGAAFTSVVSSLVKDVLSPPLGLIASGSDFSNLSLVLKEQIGETAAVSINYGLFLNACVSFLLVSLTVFIVVKLIYKPQPEKTPVTSEEIILLREIRDALVKQ